MSIIGYLHITLRGRHIKRISPESLRTIGRTAYGSGENTNKSAFVRTARQYAASK
jgi:hypothetical protein